MVAPQWGRRGGPENIKMKWTREDDVTLRRLWRPGVWDDALLAALPGRSKLVVQRRAHDLGLSRPMASSALPWTRTEDAILRAHYPRAGTSIWHERVGRTRLAVKARAAQIGVRFVRP